MVATLLERARKAREDESGFTLIELLIVIVILGILAGIVVFAVGGITDRGTVAACKSDIKTVEVASEAYFAQKGSYAPDMPTLVTAQLLHEVPTGNGYTIAYTQGPPNVITGTLAAAVPNRVTGSGTTTDCTQA